MASGPAGSDIDSREERPKGWRRCAGDPEAAGWSTGGSPPRPPPRTRPSRRVPSSGGLAWRSGRARRSRGLIRWAAAQRSPAPDGRGRPAELGGADLPQDQRLRQPRAGVAAAAADDDDDDGAGVGDDDGGRRPVQQRPARPGRRRGAEAQGERAQDHLAPRRCRQRDHRGGGRHHGPGRAGPRRARGGRGGARRDAGALRDLLPSDERERAGEERREPQPREAHTAQEEGTGAPAPAAHGAAALVASRADADARADAAAVARRARLRRRRYGARGDGAARGSSVRPRRRGSGTARCSGARTRRSPAAAPRRRSRRRCGR